jgi:hypothetical protein
LLIIDGDPVLAAEQAEFLGYVYDQIENFRDAMAFSPSYNHPFWSAAMESPLSASLTVRRHIGLPLGEQLVDYYRQRSGNLFLHRWCVP